MSLEPTAASSAPEKKPRRAHSRQRSADTLLKLQSNDLALDKAPKLNVVMEEQKGVITEKSVEMIVKKLSELSVTHDLDAYSPDSSVATSGTNTPNSRKANLSLGAFSYLDAMGPDPMTPSSPSSPSESASSTTRSHRRTRSHANTVSASVFAAELDGSNASSGPVWFIPSPKNKDKERDSMSVSGSAANSTTNSASGTPQSLTRRIGAESSVSREKSVFPKVSPEQIKSARPHRRVRSMDVVDKLAQAAKQKENAPEPPKTLSESAFCESAPASPKLASLPEKKTDLFDEAPSANRSRTVSISGQNDSPSISQKTDTFEASPTDQTDSTASSAPPSAPSSTRGLRKTPASEASPTAAAAAASNPSKPDGAPDSPVSASSPTNAPATPTALHPEEAKHEPSKLELALALKRQSSLPRDKSFAFDLDDDNDANDYSSIEDTDDMKKSPKSHPKQAAARDTENGNTPDAQEPNAEPLKRRETLTGSDVENVMRKKSSNGHAAKSTKKVNALSFMTKSHSFLKYTKGGQRHFRNFFLTKDLQALRWVSGSKSAEKTTIPLTAIDDVLDGQTTETFKKHFHAEYEIECASFSILYQLGKKKKSLDVVATSVLDRIIFTRALRILIERAKKTAKPASDADKAKAQEIIVEIQMNESSYKDLTSQLSALVKQ